jgi:hypothetical protein
VGVNDSLSAVLAGSQPEAGLTALVRPHRARVLRAWELARRFCRVSRVNQVSPSIGALEQDRDRKRIAFNQTSGPLIAKYLGEDPSLNDYEALVIALQEMSEELSLIENNLMTLADLRGMSDGEDDIYALTKKAI